MPAILLKENELQRIIRKIPDGSTVIVSGFNVSTAPEYILLALYESYEKTGHPRDLFIESDSLPASTGRGMDLISSGILETSDAGFIGGIFMPFLGWSKSLQRLVEDNAFPAYTCSIGTMAHLLREMSGGRPGLLTKVGLGTFLDPRYDGGFLNEKARSERRVKSELVTIKGEELIFITAPKPDIGLIRGTTSDEMGNISMEKEGIYGTVFTIAQSVKARPNRGKVFCQVERIARTGTINPKAVHVPGPLVDYVVIAPQKYTWQTGSIEFDPRISGGIIPPELRISEPDGDLTVRSIIQRRAAIEMMRCVKNHGGPVLANYGVGIPSEIPYLLERERVSDNVYATVEAGPWGGLPLSGEDFGVSIGPFAIIPLPDQFNLYEGGIIDLAVLGFMQVDSHGNVNPSLLPGRTPGPGGFPAIASGSPFTIFAGTFMAGGFDIQITDGRLRIVKEGTTMKFVNDVYKVLFRGEYAVRDKRDITYITERAVFRLTPRGISLEEVAPGIDIDRDIIGNMEFKPVVPDNVRIMNQKIFNRGKIGLRQMITK